MLISVAYICIEFNVVIKNNFDIMKNCLNVHHSLWITCCHYTCTSLYYKYQIYIYTSDTNNFAPYM